MKQAPKKRNELPVTIPLSKSLSAELDRHASRIGFNRDDFLRCSLACAITVLRRYKEPQQN